MRILKFGNKYITREYLTSPEYEELMGTFLDKDTDRFNLGQDLDMYKSYGFRHLNMLHVYVWRWLSIYQHRDEIMDYIFSDKVGIDFGGANGTVGGNTRIIDVQPGFDRIEDVEDYSLDYIFTSHTLEHIPNLDYKLQILHNKLKIGGIMIGVVPCYKCVRWRAPQDRTETDPIVDVNHKWTFSLEDNKYTRFDKKIEKAGFKIKKMEYAWENAIFFICEK